MKNHLLRTLVFTFLISHFSFLIGNAQWVSIPDTGFRVWLTLNYPQCMNGNQMDTNCQAILNTTVINGFPAVTIENLEGVQYFDNLERLNCSSYSLNVLPALPKNLIELQCAGCRLDSLPALPNSLVALSCAYNLLHYLPALPVGLADLRCEGNQLTVLPALPDSLRLLTCSSNQLTGMPYLPSKLLFLYCDENLISALPTLPDSLLVLYCGSNLLTSLPNLPSTLNTLLCHSNQLNTLPNLPNGLTSLYCHTNQLSSLPELPDSLYECHVYNNPITCLPLLKRIVELDFSNTLITCLPNRGNISYSNPLLNTVPVCDIYNQNDCEVFWNISGKVYLDDNSNCQYDSSDFTLAGIKLKLWNGNTLLWETITTSDGFYSFNTDSFAAYFITADTAGIAFNVSCPFNGIQNAMVTPLDSFVEDKDFALECKPGTDLAAWSIAGRFSTGRISEVNILAGVYHAHCAQGVSGTVQAAISGNASYVAPANGALMPDSVVGNVITWHITDFSLVDFFTAFNIMVQTNTTAAIGTKICITLSIYPDTIGDYNPANNILTNCFTVVGSWDPNDKQVYPEGAIDTAQEWLTYTIRFQNTGTDTAYHVYITDTLDNDLDAGSFQLLAYSHQPMVQLKENAVRFNFPNIMLVDSHANEPLSHGYVQYKIKIKDNKPIGTVINNTAFIYFDFNAPVVTNTTVNTIATITAVTPLSFGEVGVRLYPNPASNSVTISIDESGTGQTTLSRPTTITITDITGRKMAAVQLITNHQSLITDFANGVYFVTITDNQSRSVTKKLVVSK